MTEAIGYTSNIAPELAEFVRPMTAAKRHPDNVREHNLPAIAQSLQYHGQRSLVVVQKSSGLIVKGNGTHEAAELLGWDQLAMQFQEMDDDAAMRYLIADNRASDHARWARKKAEALLSSLGLEGTLWTEDEFEDLADPVIRPVADFKGDYADAGDEQKARVAAAGREGTKMKEVPVVLTAADHAVFIANLQKLMKAWGLTGYRATIVEAVTRAAGDATGMELPAPTASRPEILKELRDYFLTDGRPTWSTGAIAGFFQSQLMAMPSETPDSASEVPGQMSILDQLQ